MASFARRRFLAGSAGLSALATGTIRFARAQGADTFKIGLALPLSGPVASIGNDVHIGALVAGDIANKDGGVKGRNVELVFLDSKGTAEGIIAAARELLSRGVTLLVGGTPTPEALALIPLVDSSNAMLITSGTNAAAVTHEKFDSHIFRGTNTDAENIAAQVRLGVEKGPDIAHWATVEIDNATLVAAGTIMQQRLIDAYAKIGKTISFDTVITIKLGAGDFRNQISTLAASPVEGLYMQVYSSDAITFWQQARSFGLTKKIKMVLDRGNEISFAKAMKKNVPDNFWTLSFWNPDIYKDVPMSRRVYDAYVARTGDKVPPGFLHGGTMAVFSYVQAARAADGSADPQTLAKMLETELKIDTEIGPVYYRKQDHQAVGAVSYVKFGPADNDAGFAVYDSVKYDGASILEPPTPGVAYKG